MKKLTIILLITLTLTSCASSQNQNDGPSRLVGGPCEGCEAVFEYGDKKLFATDTLPGFHESRNKIKVTGTIYQKDGVTPAEGVILYIYHTDSKGVYAKKGEETGWGKRHGYHRGWIKTNKDGKYTFYTFKAGAYPGRSAAAHIHPVILEPNGKYYWLEDYYFEGDSLLTKKEISPDSPRGGTVGLLSLVKEDGLWVGKRDIILGENVTGY